jgi:ubiquinone/menaquinone biosynthesis C-methylase UbiE
MKKSFLKQIIPTSIWKKLAKKSKAKTFIERPDQQDLNLYWDSDYANILDEWGKDNVWNEIQLIMAASYGKVLDIACGTGSTIKLLEKYPNKEVYGFDISDLLIKKATEKNISSDRLKVTDATATNYSDNEFDYSYSIGSLEHFTLEGIDKFIGECFRYTKKASFHMIPISRAGENEGWIKTAQSYFNNSEAWWYDKFHAHYPNVYSIPSKWEDNISYGRWFVCIKQ